MSIKPFFSIITVVLNGAKTIEHTLLSVLRQTCRDMEYIIVDGGSDDGTLDILERYRSQLTIISEPDEGIYDALNKGVRLAKGEWVYILGGDDCLADTQVLEKVQAFIVRQPTELNLVAGNINLIPGRNCLHRLNSPQYLNRFTAFRGLTQQNYFVRRTLYLKAGDFDTIYQTAGDYHWLLKAVYNSLIYYAKIRLIIADFSITGRSNSYDRHLVEIRQIRTAYFGTVAAYLGHSYLRLKRLFFKSTLGKKAIFLSNHAFAGWKLPKERTFSALKNLP